MVDTLSDRRDGPEILHSAAVNDNRCFQFRVGSDSGRQVVKRQMVCGREGPSHQPFGTVGGVQRSQKLQTSSEEQESDGSFGQHHCNSPPFQVVLTPAYLPGIANLGADTLSWGKETSEKFINPIVTRQMFRRFSHPQFDIFASNRSAQVETYFSLDRRDKLSAGTNALNQTWVFYLMYAFPPPQIIPLILAKSAGRHCF